MPFRVARTSLSLAGRRYASTASQQATQTAQKASAAAAEQAKVVAEKAKVVGQQAAVAAEKGLEGLKKAGGVATAMLNTASKSSGRVGKIAQKIEAAIPPTVYYSKVGLELGKMMWRERAMSPPKVDFFQSTWKSIYESALPTLKNVSFKDALAKVRSLSSKEAASYGVIAAELVGFFTVGEIIGRRKIVGYRHKIESHH